MQLNNFCSWNLFNKFNNWSEWLITVLFPNYQNCCVQSCNNIIMDGGNPQLTSSWNSCIKKICCDYFGTSTKKSVPCQSKVHKHMKSESGNSDLPSSSLKHVHMDVIWQSTSPNSNHYILTEVKRITFCLIINCPLSGNLKEEPSKKWQTKKDSE